MIRSKSNTSLGGNSLTGKQSLTSSKSKSETVNYLILYEAMVRHQDLEYDATHDHMTMTFARIQHLGRKSGCSNNKESASAPDLVDEEDAAPKGMLTYLQMRRCLLRLGYTWNRSLPSSSGGGSVGSQSAPDYCYDDEVSVLSATSASTFTGVASNSTSQKVRDIIATDAQLIMLLTTLVEMEERHRAALLAREEDYDDDGEDGVDPTVSRGLFLPDFIQAYKLIIGGMQSLQTFPVPDDSQDGLKKACAAMGMPVDATAVKDVRTRSRERTLGLLRLFGPDSSDLCNGGDDPGLQSAGESSTARKTRDGLRPTPDRSKQNRGKLSRGSSSKSRGNMVAKDGLLPRLTEEEIRQTLQSKDIALARILEEHEMEMNVMANNMEELRLKGLKTQSLLKNRRKRMRIVAVVGVVLLMFCGGIYEYQKREQVKQEILLGREAERQADAAFILELKQDVALLTSKLGDAEAAIRYEEGRYTDVKKNYDKATKTLEENEGKWLVDRRDLAQCRAAREELDAELMAAKSVNEGMAEEVSWCRDRLSNAERAIEEMERALKKTKKGDAEVPSFADITKEIEEQGEESKNAEDAGTVELNSDKKKARKLRPLKTEMRYNKSFRHAVILRQIYSAVGGMVVSLLFPAAKMLRLLLLK